jgi:hypothetical protein
LPRDVRGFAVKFYTQEGNFDLVGNNIPVFFIQDAIKFPDLIHAVKMEADRGYPQAGSAIGGGAHGANTKYHSPVVSQVRAFPGLGHRQIHHRHSAFDSSSSGSLK